MNIHDDLILVDLIEMDIESMDNVMQCIQVSVSLYFHRLTRMNDCIQ